MTQFVVILEITEQRKITIEADDQEGAIKSIEYNFPECCQDSEYMTHTLGYRIVKIREVK